MSGEESFVILGTSPTESMENYSIIQKISGYLASSKVDKIQEETTSKKVSEVEINGDEETDGHIPKIVNNFNDNPSLTDQEHTTTCQPNVDKKSFSGSPGSSQNCTNSLSADSKNGSLAASFLLGEVELDVLKANVFSQFPSLCGSQASPEDIMKLQSFMTEYVELKNNVQKTNTTMRQHFAIMQKWQNEIKSYKEDQEKHMKECYDQIAKLRNENMEIKKELNNVFEQIRINETLMKLENEDLVKTVSEKSSVIENMCVQIEKLEQNQCNSFEYVKRNEKEKNPEYEYIRVSEHESIIKNMERKLSEVLASKLEIEDMKKVYIDEIDCLKVNLTAAEELLKKNQAEISLLKCKDCEKSELFEKFEKEKEQMKQEIGLLRVQVDVYSTDFQMERTARQNLAGEKEQLLNDLKMLQKRNQQLIEEASARLEADVKRNATNLESPIRKRRESPSSTTKVEKEDNSSNFVCPLCSNSYKCLDALQEHVQECLDKA